MKRLSAFTALSAVAACLLLFSACNGLDGAGSGAEPAPSSSASQASAAPQAPTPTPTLTPTPTPTPTPAPVYDDSLISDLYDLEGTYTDGVGNEYSYAFHLPQITSEAAGPVNEAIRKDFADLIEEELAVMQDGTSLILYDVQYESYWHDDMVSLVVTARNGWGMNKYGVYHYCFSDGSAPNASALLPLAGISEEEFLQRVPEVLEDAFYQYVGMQ